MPREFARNDRVASQIQRELAGIIQREIKDPRLGFISVNAVKVTRDLSVAKVYVTSIEEKSASAQATFIEILAKAVPFIRHELSGRMRIRNIPDLRFVYDESIEQGRRISMLLDGLENNQSDSD